MLFCPHCLRLFGKFFVLGLYIKDLKSDPLNFLGCLEYLGIINLVLVGFLFIYTICFVYYF